MRRLTIAAAVTVLTMTGCSGAGDDERSSSTRPAAAADPSSKAAAADTSSKQFKAVGGDTASFGESFEFEDGLSIAVSQPKEFTPSPNATTGGEGKYVKFTVRLVNRTSNRIAPSNVSVSLESGGGQGGDVIDKDRAISGPPAKPVKPGGRASWVQGFGVLDPKEVAILVQAEMSRIPVAFTS